MSGKLTKCKCGTTFTQTETKTMCDGCTFKQQNEKDKKKDKFDIRVLS